MSMMRRYAAALVAASALTLGACGSEAPTVPLENGGEAINDNPLLIQINPGAMLFQSATNTAPGPQTLAVSGLVAIGSAAEFGAPMYSGNGSGWLNVDPRPTFRRDPLAWLHPVSINQAAFSALPVGVYTATVPVIVRAAINTPQMLGVLLCKGSSDCLAVNGTATGSLSGTEPIWDWFVALGNPPTWNAYYDDWYMALAPGESTYIRMNGGGCGVPGGTLSDPFLFVYEGTSVTDITNWVTWNDDSDCLNSQVFVSNNSNSTQIYTIRATSFSNLGTGTYTLISQPNPYVTLMADDATEHPLVTAKRNAGH